MTHIQEKHTNHKWTELMISFDGWSSSEYNHVTNLNTPIRFLPPLPPLLKLFKVTNDLYVADQWGTFQFSSSLTYEQHLTQVITLSFTETLHLDSRTSHSLSWFSCLTFPFVFGLHSPLLPYLLILQHLGLSPRTSSTSTLLVNSSSLTVSNTI